MKRLLHAIAILCALVSGPGPALAQFKLPGFGGDGLLPPEKAFRLEAHELDARAIEVRYEIADGYYMYRERFKFSLTAESDAALGAPEFPPGLRKTDEFFGEVETYRKGVRIRIPLERRTAGAQALKLNVTSQGCADVGVCYTPQDAQASIRLAALDATEATGGAPLRYSLSASDYDIARLFEGNFALVLAGFLALLACTALLVGALSGGRDLLRPLAARVSGQDAGAPSWVRIASLSELDERLRAPGRLVVLDFHADWCVTCKEMESFTFSDPRVRARLASLLLLQVDVTANSVEDKRLLRRFSLFGPPGMILFDAEGREIPGARVIGYQNAERFLRTLERVRPAL